MYQLIESALMMAKYYYLKPAALNILKANLFSMILITSERQHKAILMFLFIFIIITILKYQCFNSIHDLLSNQKAPFDINFYIFKTYSGR